MKHALLIIAVLISHLLTPTAPGGEPASLNSGSGLRWPLDVTRRITSTFAEMRPDRFHAALDFSINGTIGTPCFAVADGYVSHIRTSFTGYGRVLYFTLDSGDIAVYAHLYSYEGRVEAALRGEQLKQGHYEVDLWFPAGEVRYKKGDVIAYCGDTGSGPPHLHFEMRTPANDPFNPVLAGFRYEDNSAPFINRVAIRPLDGDSEVEGGMEPVVREVVQGVAAPVRFYGRVGISAEPEDLQDGGWYRIGIHELELFVDDTLRHHTTLDTFSYALNSQSRLEFDYGLQRAGYKEFNRLYITPGNKLTFYDRTLRGGILDSRTSGPGVHSVRVVVIDHRGNRGEMTWRIEAQSKPTLPFASEQDTLPDLLNLPHRRLQLPLEIRFRDITAEVRLRHIPDSIDVAGVYTACPAYRFPKKMVRRQDGSWYARAALSLEYAGNAPFQVLLLDSSGIVYVVQNEITVLPLKAGKSVDWTLPEQGVSLRMDGAAIPWSIVAGLTITPGDSKTDAPVYTLLPRDFPFLERFRFTLDGISAPWDSQSVLVYRERADRDWQFLSAYRERDNFLLAANVFSFESFSVSRDTIPPEILNVSPHDGALLTTHSPELTATILDRFSGLSLDRCDLRLDGRRVIWVYDPDKSLISYEPWEPLEPGTYSWTITVTDKTGNRSELRRTFTIQ